MTYQFQAVRFRDPGHNTEMYTEHVIAKVQRVKVIGVCSAVNMFVKLVGTLYSCKFQRSLRCRGGCYGMTQVLYISTSANNRANIYGNNPGADSTLTLPLSLNSAVFFFYTHALNIAL